MKEFDELPKYSPVDHGPTSSRRRRRCRRVIRLAVLAGIGYLLYSATFANNNLGRNNILSVSRLENDYAECGKLRRTPEDPHGPRERNARYVEGQSPILIRNATVWTGEPSFEVTPEQAYEGIGYEWVRSDVLLQSGLIALVAPDISDKDLPDDTQVWDAKGRQLTAGIVDMHSHAGVDSLPGLEGNADDNEMSVDITPFVRSKDGLNPLDKHIQVIKSGGVTTSLILPGSGNNIGGEAFVIKHSVGKADGRPELSIEDMMADPEHNWRYMKMACGENAKSVYGKLGRDHGPFSRCARCFSTSSVMLL